MKSYHRISSHCNLLSFVHSRGAVALRARLEGEAGVVKRSEEKLATKAEVAINNSCQARVALARALARVSSFEVSQRHSASRLVCLAKLVAAAALPRLHISITANGAAQLGLLPTVDHNFVISWSGESVRNKSSKFSNARVRLDNSGKQMVRCWWDSSFQPQFLSQHAATISVT